jgi:hypothetical protein
MPYYANTVKSQPDGQEVKIQIPCGFPKPTICCKSIILNTMPDLFSIMAHAAGALMLLATPAILKMKGIESLPGAGCLINYLIPELVNE